MKQLIVNADDFGYTSGVNRAIIAASRAAGDGIITAASLLANSASFEEAVALARATPGLDVGCHLNLVEGKPVSPASRVSSLISATGEFLGARGLALRLITAQARLEEMERECCAQIELLISRGVQPSHVDTHQHTHLHPRVMMAVAGAAQRYGIQWVRRPFESLRGVARRAPLKRRLLAKGLAVLAHRFDQTTRKMRIGHTDHFTGFALTGSLNVASLLQTLESLPEGTTELMCHPGYADAALAAASTNLTRQREEELAALRDSAILEALRANQIRLVSFRDLPAPAPHWAEDRLAASSAVTGEPAAGRMK